MPFDATPHPQSVTVTELDPPAITSRPRAFDEGASSDDFRRDI